MNISDVIYSFGTLSIINFARKHMEKLREHPEVFIASLADRIQNPFDALELAYTARRPLTSLWTRAATAKDAANEDLDGFMIH